MAALQNPHTLAPYNSNNLALNAAKFRIRNPPENKHYEHYVGSWACTKLKQVFYAPCWVITPEKSDAHSKKKPDLAVEKVTLNPNEPGGYEIKYHLLMELKSNDPSIRFEEALAQVVEEIQETMEDRIEVYVVVQCGMKIGFFEYHNDQGVLDEEEIDHFRGCTSLTDPYVLHGAPSYIIPNVPQNLERLKYDYDSRLKDPKRIAIRNDAEDYQVSCIFDIQRHQNEVDFLFHHMVTNEPRSSI